jgi:hypothetical protein
VQSPNVPRKWTHSNIRDMTETQTTSQKIQELFAFRRIPELLRMAGIEPDSPFVTRLYRLQEVIYDLDLYLETNWAVRKKDLKAHWNQIHEAMSAFGIEKSAQRKYLDEIKLYQEHELNLRKYKVPGPRKLKALYENKSCDVKLTRKLIYRHAPGLEDQIAERDWWYFDLATEVNDDVHDVYEDCETINGNRFLLSLLLRGEGKTWKLYKAFLESIGNESRKHFKKRKHEYEMSVYRWTREIQKETEDLLRETMDHQKLSLVSRSKIAHKLKGQKSLKM